MAKYNGDGTLAWAKPAGCIGDNQFSVTESYAVAWGADNTAVITGKFNYEATFGIGEPNETTLFAFDGPMGGEEEIFVAKYTMEGALVWAQKAGTELTNDFATAVTQSKDGSVFFAGYHTEPGEYAPAPTNKHQFIPAVGVFLGKITKDGTLAWQRSVADHLEVFQVTALPDGSSIWIGEFSSNRIFGEGEINETTLTAAGMYSFFIAKYLSDGKLAWAKGIGSESFDGAASVTSFEDGSFLVTGYLSGTTLFGAGEPNETLISITEGESLFVAMYKSDGTLKWVRNAESKPNGNWRGVHGVAALALQDGSAIIAGMFRNSVVLGAGELAETTLLSVNPKDMFAAIYNSDGTLKSANMIAGSTQCFTENPLHRYIVAIAEDSSIAVAGSFTETTTLGLGGPVEIDLFANTDESVFNQDMFVAKFIPGQDENFVF